MASIGLYLAMTVEDLVEYILKMFFVPDDNVCGNDTKGITRELQHSTPNHLLTLSTCAIFGTLHRVVSINALAWDGCAYTPVRYAGNLVILRTYIHTTRVILLVVFYGRE